MNLPIILDNHGDVLIFDSAEAAEKYVEAIDVENEEYVGYDSQGGLLDLRINSSNHVLIDELRPTVHRPEELLLLLRRFLADLGIDQDWLSRASLDEILAKASSFKMR